MKRCYLFLQGPHGPFFRELGRRLRAKGHDVLRVNFNGGDWFDWLGADAQDFRGTDEQWPGFCEQICQSHQVTDLVLYGDCRNRHRQAIELARLRDIRIHAFEEGYLRPDWVTLEEEGVNGHSTLPKSPGWYLSNALDNPPKASRKVGRSMRWLLMYCLRYYFWKSLLSSRFEAYVSHRPYRPSQEFLLWVRYLLRMPLLRWRSRRYCRQLRRTEQAYYLVGLQLDSDAQLRVHSRFLSVADFLSTVLRSFAQYAPENSLLVIKKHPLDPDAVSYDTLSMIEAYALGIRGRVIFLHQAALPELIQGAQGVVVVNSTVGASAIHHGCPTIALGDAVYGMEGLTWAGGLDQFWRQSVKPDKSLYQAFRTHLLNSVLINGGFFSPRGRKFALPLAVARLCAARTCQLSEAMSDNESTPEAEVQKQVV